MTHYIGPLFDAMAQIEAGMSSLVLKSIETSDVYRMALFARQQPQRHGESDVLALKKNFPDRFVIGVPKQFDVRNDLTEGFIRQAIGSLDAGAYQFVGEILFAHADKSDGEQTATGARHIAADGKQVSRFLAALEHRPVPVMTHWEVYNWQREWPKFHALYARFPSTTFIWPHAGFASPEQAAMVVSSHPNVVITLSKKEADPRHLSSQEKQARLGLAIVDTCNHLRPEWRSLLARYPDRFLFATDAHKDVRWKNYAHIVHQWRLILGQLPDALAQALAWRNAERIYKARR